MAKKLRALPRILVIEDSQHWNERLANMYCRILRQVDGTIDSNSLPKACRQCSQTSKCFGIQPQESSTKNPREELVKIAKDTSEALQYLEVSDADLQLKKRNFDIISLDQNLGDGSTGDSLLRDAASEGRRVAVIAITGFRNDSDLKRTMGKDYESIWNFRNHIESLSNGVCEVFEKSALTSDAIRVVRDLIDTTLSSDNEKVEAYKILNKIEYANKDSSGYQKQIDEEVRRIEASLPLGYLQNLVARTDRDRPLNLRDRLGLHFEIDDALLQDNFPEWCILVAINNNLKIGNVTIQQLNGMPLFKTCFKDVDSTGELMCQLVTRLSYLATCTGVKVYCSVVRDGQDITKFSPMVPFNKLTKNADAEQNAKKASDDADRYSKLNNPLAVLLIRLCVDKILGAVTVDKDSEFFKHGLRRFGLKVPTLQDHPKGNGKYSLFESTLGDCLTDGTRNLVLPEEVNPWRMGFEEIEMLFQANKKHPGKRKLSTHEIISLRAEFASVDDLAISNPFYFYFGENVTPRLHYNPGDKERTPDPRHVSDSLNPFLRGLFSTNDEIIERIDGTNIYKLRPQVCIYLHRKKTISEQEAKAYHVQLSDAAANTISMRDD